MPTEEIIIVVILALTLAILFAVFDTIKRTRGTFNRGWKVLFFAFSLFFAFEFLDHLTNLHIIGSEFKPFEETLEVIFLAVILFVVVVANKKIRKSIVHKKSQKNRQKYIKKRTHRK